MEPKLIVKKNILYYFPIIILLSLIVGFRGSTRDTEIYYTIFKNIEYFNLLNPKEFYMQSGVEIGFGWYSYIIGLFSDSSIVLFSIYSFLTFYFIYKICQLLEISLGWILLFYLSSAYFVIQQFMQIRQGLATPIALYALVVLFKENKFSLKFWLLSLFAVSMHQISSVPIVVGVIIYFFINIIQKISLVRFKVITFLVFVLITVATKFVIVDWLLQFSSRIMSYSEIDEHNESLGLFRLPNIKAFMTFLILLFLMNKRFYQDKIFVLFYLLFTLSLAFRIGFIDFAILSGRFSTAFAYSEIFILPLVLFRFKSPMGGIFLFIFIVAQAIATYGFQVPDDLYPNYFEPLKEI